MGFRSRTPFRLAPAGWPRPAGGTSPTSPVAASAPAALPPGRRTWFTGRMAVLALVAGALLLALMYPARIYLGQRGQIAELRRRTQTQQVNLENLKEQEVRWNNPAYVRAQARQRLHYVMPGETGYVTVETKPEAQPGGTPTGAAVEPGAVPPPSSIGNR